MTGRLFTDPALVLGHSGSTIQRSAKQTAAPSPMMKKDSVQPKRCPSLVPIGTPSTVATMVPPMTAASPTARFPAGAMRAASGVMIDQKTECVRATPTRVA